MPLQQILPTWMAINASDDLSPSHLVDIRTGQPLFAGGLNGGDYFDLTEKEANDNSFTEFGILHSGRYRRVRVDPGATATLVVKGRLGFMPIAQIPNVNIVTSADHGLLGVRTVVFLNTVTPGNWCFIQELGIASVTMGGAGAIGAQVSANATGLATAGATHPIGNLLDVGVNNQPARVLLDLPVLQG